jgi:hypothetical protein
MKYKWSFFVILAIALMSQVLVGSQQSNNTDFSSFWEKFKTAVIKGDKNTVVTLSKFPIQMSYGIKSIKTKAELVRRYREVFNQQTDAAKCFANKEPEKDETSARKFSIACPDEAGNEVVIFQFARDFTGWKFVGLDNLNE